MTTPTSVLIRGLKATEATLALLVARFLVFVVPFRLTARMFPPREPDDAPAEAAAEACGHLIGRRVARVADHLPWTSTCLVRALAGALLLARRGTVSHIRVGVRKEDGRLAGHAWLMVGTASVIGGAASEGYVPLADLVSS